MMALGQGSAERAQRTSCSASQCGRELGCLASHTKARATFSCLHSVYSGTRQRSTRRVNTTSSHHRLHQIFFITTNVVVVHHHQKGGVALLPAVSLPCRLKRVTTK
jgi:hypothetical protein